MSQTEEFAVSDQAGNYVFYTNDHAEANRVAADINSELDEGCAAIMKRVDGGDHYELYL